MTKATSKRYADNDRIRCNTYKIMWFRFMIKSVLPAQSIDYLQNYTKLAQVNWYAFGILFWGHKTLKHSSNITYDKREIRELTAILHLIAEVISQVNMFPRYVYDIFFS